MKRTKITVILISLMLILSFIAAGMSLAIWIQQEGASVYLEFTVDDDNPSIRYQIFVPVDSNGDRIDGTMDVPLENIQAVMVARVPVLGGIYRFIMSTTGLLIVIIIPMALMLGVLVFRLIENIKKTTDKKELTREEIIAKEAVEEFKKKQLEQEIAQKAVQEYKNKNNIKD